MRSKSIFIANAIASFRTDDETFYGGKNLRKIPLPLSRPSNQLSVIITLKKIKIYSKSIALSLREIDDV